MTGKRFGWAIAVLGLLLLLYNFVFYVQEAVRLRGWLAAGSNDTELRTAGTDSLLVFGEVDPVDFPPGPLPAKGDTLLAIVTAAGDSLDRAALRSFIPRPGDRVAISYLRAGETLNTEMLYSERHGKDIAFIAALELTRVLITLGFLLVGLWAVTRRPDQAGVRALALFSFAMSSLMLGGVQLGLARYPAFAIPGQKLISGVIGAMILSFGVFWLNLQLYFPAALNWVRRHTLRAHLLLYAPQIVIVIATLRDWPGAGIGISIAMSIYTFGGFLVLVQRKRRATEPLVKRQLSLVIWGSGLGLGMLFVLVVLGSIPGLMAGLPDLLQIALIQGLFLALLLSPISFAYAFGRYRLLEVEGRLRRGTRYVLVTGVLLALFFVLLYGISSLLLGGLKLGWPLADARRGLAARPGRHAPAPARPERLRRAHLPRAAPPARDPRRVPRPRGHPGRSQQPLRPPRAEPARGPAHHRAGAGDGRCQGGAPAPARRARPCPSTSAASSCGPCASGREPLLVDELRASGRLVLSDAEDAWLADAARRRHPASLHARGAAGAALPRLRPPAGRASAWPASKNCAPSAARSRWRARTCA